MKYFACALFVLVAIGIGNSLATAGAPTGGFFVQSVHADTTPQSLPFTQDWSNVNMITANDDWSGVPGIVGYRGDTSTSITGLDPRTIVAPRTDTIDVIANQASPNTLTSGGVAEFDGIPNPTIALQGSGTADAPFILLNVSTLGQTNVTIQYNVRDIDGSADNAVQQVALQYRVGTSGDFTNIPAGYIADATTGPNLATLVTPISAALPSDAENQPHVQIRIITTNAVGSDEWVGIDDISITAGPPAAPLFSANKSEIAFGNLIVGTTHSDTVTVTNTGTASLTVSSVTSSNPVFLVAPSGGLIPPSGSEFFVVTITPPGAGLQTGTLTFLHDAAGSPSSLGLSARGLDTGIAVAPTSLSFGSLLVGSTHTDTIVVSNGGPGPLTISSAATTTNQFLVTPSSAGIPELGDQMFFVTFAPTSQGVKTAQLLLTNDKTGSPVAIPLDGTGVGGAFSASPKTLPFADLFISTTAVETVTVTNNGGGTLTISSVTSSNADFTVDPVSGLVGPSETAKFAVTFAPTTTGLKSANIVFLHDGPTLHDTVRVSGRGIQLFSIAAARALPNGTEVTIEGIMTRSLGAFMRIQDSTAGLSIRQASGAFFDSVASGGIRAGDSVRITGLTSEFNSLKQINGTDFYSFRRLDRDHAVPAAQLVTLAELAAHGEQYESELVTVTGVTIRATGTFTAATTYQIRDASDTTQAVSLRIPNAADSQVDGLSIPTGPVTVTCVLGQFSSADPAAGYQLLAVLSGDIQIQVGVTDRQPLPEQFALKGNYPNPFNPATTIAFDIPAPSSVTIVVYNLLGQEVAAILRDAEYSPGRYTVNFDASRLASGAYLYRMTAKEFSAVKRMLIVK
jgi:hypothetical protein